MRRDAADGARTPSDPAAGLLTIDLDALRANYRRIQGDVAPAECAAVVKADAYGLGAARIGPALRDAGCRSFFVALAKEGAALRAVLPEARIYVLEGCLDGEQDLFLDNGLWPVLNSLPQVRDWAALARRSGRPLPAALHLDTGMARLGLSGDEVAALAAEPAPLRAFPLALVMSHLACADLPDSAMNAAQRAEFLRLKARLPPAPLSLANSAGCYLGSRFHFDLVRPGVALYGGRPHPGRAPAMTPVLHWETPVLQVREVAAGTAIGYGAAARVGRPSRLATIAVGYADGYKRALSHSGAAVIDGVRVPVVGRVSMDLVTLDVTDLPPGAVWPGRRVELLGAGLTIDDLAAAGGTIAHDVLTGLGRRVARAYVEEGQSRR